MWPFDRLARVERKVDAILSRLETIYAKEIAMSKEVDDIRAAVAKATTVAQSAVTLIGGLAQQIQDLKNDPVALEQLATDLNAQADGLAAAVSANTPAAPA